MDKRELLKMSFEDKVQRSKELILEWYLQYRGKVYVSFSGGKDSTVLLHLCRSIKGCENVPGVFSDTGLEYPEIRQFVKKQENIIWIKPKMTFKEVIEKYGWPVVSKEVAQKISEIRNTGSEKLRNKRLYGDEKGNGRLPAKWLPMVDAPFKITSKCCNIMKKNVFAKFERESGLKPILGVMATESKLRMTKFLRGNCNAFSSAHPKSEPLSFWTEEDIWEYIRRYNVEICEVYTKCGLKRTGCMFCMFGCHLGGDKRFEIMRGYWPKQYEYIMDKLGGRAVFEEYMRIAHLENKNRVE